MMNKKALIIGATGATGTSLVKQLLENEHYSFVDVFARREASFKHSKLTWHVVDFNALESWKDQLKEMFYFQLWAQRLKLRGSKKSPI